MELVSVNDRCYKIPDRRNMEPLDEYFVAKTFSYCKVTGMQLLLTSFGDLMLGQLVLLGLKDHIDDEIAVRPFDTRPIPTCCNVVTSAQFKRSDSTFSQFAQACMAECALSTWGILTSLHSNLLTTQVHRRWSSFADGSQRIQLCMTFVKQAVGHTSICGAGHRMTKAAAPILLRLKGGGRSKEKVQTLVVEEASLSCRDDSNTGMVYHRNALDVEARLEGTLVPDAGGCIEMYRQLSRANRSKILAREDKRIIAKLFASLKRVLHAPCDAKMANTLEIAISSIDSMLGELRSQPLLVDKRILFDDVLRYHTPMFSF